MRFRSAAAGAALALCAALFAAPTSTAASSGVKLVFDTWAPSVGDCEQHVTFRLVPSVSDEGPTPTGTVRLMSDAGGSLGSVSVHGFGRYEVAAACANDTGHHRVTLAYDGDAAYLPESVSSPDTCPRETEMLSPEAWHVMVGAGDPRPVFMCRTNAGHSIRSQDGRLHATGGWSVYSPNPVTYGQRVLLSFEVDGRPASQPTAPTGTAVARLDGKKQRTFDIDGRNEYDWTIGTARMLPGTHSLSVAYSGDQRWAPVLIARHSFKLVKGWPTGEYSVKRWQLERGQRPVVTIRFRNTWSREAKAPTGVVSFYLGDKHVYDTRLRPRHDGRRTITLPPTRRVGTQLLRVVYRGDSRYKRLDSTGARWYSSQQYIQVR